MAGKTRSQKRSCHAFPDVESEQLELNEWASTVAIARAVAVVSDFTLTGTEQAFERADQQLRDAAIVSSSGSHPAWWWVVRLLRLMLEDFEEASLLNVLPRSLGMSLQMVLSATSACLHFPGSRR
ncbi:MAG: hypothetical protein U1F14_16915 [Steroidobacteraceae bacterium]